MKNYLFYLIDENLSTFKKMYSVEKIKSAEKNNFYCVKGEQVSEQKFEINSSEYQLVEWHFSVYEDSWQFEGESEIGYHITVKLVNLENGDLFKSRIYFDEMNKEIGFSFKNSKEENVAVDNKEIIVDIFRVECYKFYNLLRQVQLKKQREGSKEHDRLLVELENLSRQLVGKHILTQQIKAWSNYIECLNLTLTNLEAWRRFEFDKEKIPYDYFLYIKNHAETRLNEIEKRAATFKDEQILNLENSSIEAAVTAVKLPVLNQKSDKLRDINGRLKLLATDKQCNAAAKVVREYELQEEKFKAATDDDDILGCVLRMKALQTQSQDMLRKLMSENSLLNSITDEELKQLIKVIPTIEITDIFLAVNKNQAKVLELLLSNHTDINLNSPVGSAGKILLEIAYEKGYDKILKVLLEHGADPNVRFSNGRTLLNQACLDKRRIEIELSLDHKASLFSRDIKGYTAFAMLTMHSSQKPDLALIKLIEEKDPQNFQFVLDYMQGSSGQRCSPLMYACQKGWFEAVKFYIERGARATGIRETEGLHTAVEVAVAKNFPDILQFMLEHAVDKEMINLNRALMIADEIGSKEVKAILAKYEKSYSEICQITVLPGTTPGLRDLIHKKGTVLFAPPTDNANKKLGEPVQQQNRKTPQNIMK